MQDMESQIPCRSPQQQYFKLIRDFLDRNNVEYKSVHHEETFTSEESSRVRGVPLSTGGKALLLKVSDGGGDSSRSSMFALFVMSASRKLNSKAIKKEFKTRGKTAKDIRFASAQELADITGGLVPGCVPPFGRPILKASGDPFRDNTDDDSYLELYVDTSIAEENETIAFNAGSLTDSVIMSVPEYLRVSIPTGIFTFSKK